MVKQVSKQSPSFWIGILGCLGGLFIQLVIGSLYQWGIMNIYVTSYFQMSEANLTLQSTGIVFPLMMICIGLTMRLGLLLSQFTHPLLVMGIGQVLQAVCIFVSSEMKSFWMFIFFYGIIFGLIAGNSFMIPIDQCNKYLVGKKMIVNGIILMGTGLGSVVFGQFSYNFLNPQQIPPQNGYYLGTIQLEDIALKVPILIKWLSLLYLVIGLLGVLMISPVCLYNRKIKNQKQKNSSQKQQKNNQKLLQHIQISQLRNKHDQLKDHHQELVSNIKQEKTKQQGIIKDTQIVSIKQASSIKQAFGSKIFWLSIFILFFGASGCFMISGNYKTYVRKTIQDDQFLTIIGVIGAVGNGCSRFLWNLLFSKTGYKTVLLSILSIAITVFSTIRFTTQLKGVYLIEIFFVNICLGGFLVTTPTVSQYIYGQSTGANIYCFFWQNFAIANLLGYVFVSQLAKVIGFNNVIYVSLAMCSIAFPLVIITTFQGPWKNDINQLQYLNHPKQQDKKPLQNAVSNNVPIDHSHEDLAKFQNPKPSINHEINHFDHLCDGSTVYSLNH